MKKVLFLNVFSGLALFACMDNSTAPEQAGPKGSARVKLPVVPESVLALAKTGSSPVEPTYSFSITVSGPGMSSRTQTWDAVAFGGATVTLEDIPAGPARVFTGRILRGVTKTHEGSYTVDIGGGESVFVPLVLRDVRSGRAEICVEVEGWPNPKCTPIDTVPADTFNLSGCWNLSIYDGTAYVNGILSIVRMEGYVYGTFRGSNGITYSANPQYWNGAWRVTLIPLRPIDFDPGFGGGVIIEDGKDMPQYKPNAASIILPVDTLILPIDTGSYRTIQLRIDHIDPGMYTGSLGYVSGMTMDPYYTVVRGQFKGYSTSCGEIVIDDPVDTSWVIDSMSVHDGRKTVQPAYDYRLE